MLAGKRNPDEVDFELLISFAMLDRNSNVRFDKSMVATELQKSPVHGLVQSPAYIK
jgi:hypothetical protein